MFSDEEAREILKRAVTLHQARELQWSEQELLRAAGEVGIDDRAVRAAIAEVKSSRASVVDPERSPMSSLEIGGFAALGAATVLPVALFVNPLASVVILGATTVLLALDSSSPRPYRRLLGRSAALWAGFWGGAAMLFSVEVEAASVLITALPVVGGMSALLLGRLLKWTRDTRGGPGIIDAGRGVFQRL